MRSIRTFAVLSLALAGPALRGAQAVPLSIVLDPAASGIAVSATAQAPGTNAATFPGSLDGDLLGDRFTLNPSGVYAPAGDILVTTTGSVSSAVGSVDYTIDTTLSGFSFSLSSGQIQTGPGGGWLLPPLVTPEGGVLSSALTVSFASVLFGSGVVNGTAGGAVDPSAVRAGASSSASLLEQAGVLDLDSSFDVLLSHAGVSLDLPGLPVFAQDLVVTALHDHYDATLAATGFLIGSATVPEPGSAALLALGLAGLALRPFGLRVSARLR